MRYEITYEITYESSGITLCYNTFQADLHEKVITADMLEATRSAFSYKFSCQYTESVITHHYVRNSSYLLP